MILAIDSSIGSSAALVDPDGRVIAERSELDTMRHAEVIGALIRAVLGDAGVTPDQVRTVVAGKGPGPFTGLRIGIAAATTFALGRGVPLVSIVSHDAIAREWALGGGRGTLTVSTDARRRELYWSTYRVSEHGDAEGELFRAQRIDGPSLARPADLVVVGTHVSATQVSAGSLGQIVAFGLKDGTEFPDLPALYLRSPDVTPAAGAKRVTA